MSQVNAQARTTRRTRTEIKEASGSLAELAERYNISRSTARKWRARECPLDRSHRPHQLNTTLSPVQEAIVVELRCTTLLPLDDLVAVVREFIHPSVSRSGLDCCLRRHGVANLRQLQAKALNIEHRLCPPRHPQTNGMVERFNGRISEVVNQTRFASAAQLEATLDNYVKTYNHLIPQRALNHLSPVQALKNWYAKKPQLFVKSVQTQNI